MDTTNEKIYEEIQEILEKNKDAVKGFSKAAENSKSVPLKAYFTRKSSERKAFNEKLISEIKNAYIDFDVDGSFSGTIHRAWMDVKALFSSDNDESMLEESIRGDKAAIDEYDDILEYKALPLGLKQLLKEQRGKIHMDLVKNKTLEDLV
jgi:uncharacterized protein (TIGR02284 family)